MPSEEALRAAKRLLRGYVWMTDRQIERAAQSIDREFAGLREAYAKLAEERNRLRSALGRRGRADCPKCDGLGYTERPLRECECRKELGL